MLGIDIVRNDRVKTNSKFYAHVLHVAEIAVFKTFTSEQRKIEFMAGRWALKEAIFKAIGWDFLPFPAILIERCASRRLIVKFDLALIRHVMARTQLFSFDFEQKQQIINVSLSHERDYSVAVAFICNKKMHI